MTRVNGKGPMPEPKLRPIKVERGEGQSAALFEVMGGEQDGGGLAVSVVHPGGVPMLAVQVLLDAHLREVRRGVIDPTEAMRLIQACK